MKFNINNPVKVRITEVGMKMHRAEHDRIKALAAGMGAHMEHWHPYTPPRIDADGWCEMQLWDVMRVFGHGMGNGLPVPIETEIEILENAH